MEKLLAMSILSSTPADISGAWMDVAASVWRNSKKTGNHQEENDKRRASDCKGGEQKPAAADKKNPMQQQKRGSRASYAPEFDGLNCFETLVSH